MANTFLCHRETNLAGNTIVCGVFNDNGGTNVLRVRRMGFINMDDGGSDGSFSVFELKFFENATSWTTSVAARIRTMDTAYSAPAHLIAGHGGNPTTTGAELIMRRMNWTSKAATIGTSEAEAWQTFVPFGVIFDGGYHDTAVQAIALRVDEALIVESDGSTDNSVQWWAEVTQEAS